MSSIGFLSGRRGRGGRQSRRGHTDRGGRVSRQPRTSPIVVVEDIQLVPPGHIEVVPLITRGEQRTSRVRTRGGQSAIRTAPRIRTRGGRSTRRVRARGVQARGGRDSAGDISLAFYKSMLPSPSNNRPAEEMDPVIFGERLEVPMHIKRPRLWPMTHVSVSPRASTSTPEAPSSVSSPVLFMEIGENEPTNLDVQMTQSPSTRSNLEMDVPSPAQFIECGGSRASTPCTIRASETFPPRTRRILTDIEIDNILNYGSEEESESEDEALPVLVPRNQRILFGNDGAEDEALVTSIAPPAPSTNLPEGSGHIGFSEEAMLYRTPAGPERFLFNWTSFPETPIASRNRREVFREAEGPVLDFAGQSLPSPEAIFLSIWDTSIMAHIVTETNRYAEDEILKKQGTLGPESRLHRWTPTNVDELYIYFGVLLAMGICIKTDIKEYWHCDGSICDTPNFAKYMSYNRFILLSKFIHFTNNNNNSISSLSPSETKIYKIKPIADHLNQKFQSLYKLKQNICIDESLTQWKGWLAINQFIKNKAASIGIKTYEVCDAKSGYLWRFKIHSGNQPASTSEPPTPLSGIIPSLVLHLLQGLENRGHCVWMDNYYNSPALARALKSMGFDCVGTLRTNRQFVPRFTSHRGFRLELINKLLNRKVEPPVAAITTHGGVRSFTDDYFRHLPKEYRCLPGRNAEKLRRVCVVCRKRTHVYCPGCAATLCPFTCFVSYHANK